MECLAYTHVDVETQYHDLQVEIYLALDHPHIARLMMVYEDDQAG